MTDEQYTVAFKGQDEGFGASARAVVREIGTIRSAINSLPSDAIRGIGAQLAAVFSFDYVKDRITEVVNYGSAIQDTAQKLNVSTQFIQKATYAAEQSGGSMRSVTTAMRDLMRSQAEALRNPRGQDSNAFRAIGVSIEELKRLSAEQLFDRVARSIQNGSGTASEMSAAMTILGRSAIEVLPMMREGFADLSDQFVEIGGLIDSELIEKLDEAGDAAHRAGVKAKGGWAWLAGKGMEGLGKVQDFFESIVQQATAAYDARANPEFYKGLGGSKGAIANAEEAVRQMQRNEQSDAASVRKARRERAGRGIGAGEIPNATEGATVSGVAGKIASDALQRIGLFIGGSQTNLDIQRRHLNVSQQMLELNRRIAAITERSWS